MEAMGSNTSGSNCSDQTQALLSALKTMMSRHDQGDIDHVLPVGEFSGDHASIARAVNDLVGAHIAVKLKVVDVIRHYGKGDFSAEMDRLPGKKAVITEAMDGVRKSMREGAELAKSATRIKNALDVTSTNVMIADPDGQIVYTNKSVSEMLANAEGVATADIACAVAQVYGACE